MNLACLKKKTETIPALTVGVFDEDTSTIEIPVCNTVTTLKVDSSQIKIIDVSKIGDRFSHKICNTCHRILPISNFEPNQKRMRDSSTIFRPSCGSCRTVVDGVSISTAERNKILLSKPADTIVSCPICNRSTIPGVTSKYVIDHDHATGKIRGWLCDSCNTGIGRFADDPLIVLNALEYLVENSTLALKADYSNFVKIVKDLRNLLNS